ncbi:MAG: YfcE family phosphodiesterase [bacterium]|nr:YfcE family phosphodiesterase [bacterium]
MLVGVMSDSHGQDRVVAAALRLFDELKVAHIIHCGDVGGTPVLDQFVGRACSFVWGNTDEVDRGMRAYLKTVALPVPPPPPLRLELAGKVILVFHGHEQGLERALHNGEVDYVLRGHSHRAGDECVGGVRVINPGALCRAQPRSVATLDLDASAVTFYAADPSGESFVPWRGC